MFSMLIEQFVPQSRGGYPESTGGVQFLNADQLQAYKFDAIQDNSEDDVLERGCDPVATDGGRAQVVEGRGRQNTEL